MISVFKIPTLQQATTPCPHCGRQLLTTSGIIHIDFFPRLANTPYECNCPQACQERARQELVEQERVKQEQEAAAQHRAQRSGIPARYLNLTFADYLTRTPSERTAKREAQTFINRFINEPTAKGLFIIGTVGTGKTYLSSIICNTLHRHKTRLLWRNLSDILQEFRDCYSKKATVSESTVLDRYINVPILVLDDLGKERITEWAQGLLFALINKRSEKMKRPLIVTANYGRAKLAERLTPEGGDLMTAQAIVDRIIGSSVTLQLVGDSHRTGELAK